MANFLTLPCWNDAATVNVVVETPRGSLAKFDYDPKLEVFKLSKSLMLGLAYPADFGFVPSTLAEDGDPIDAIILHDTVTAPGVIIPCRLLGGVAVVQRDGGEKYRNDRLIAVPVHAHRCQDLRSIDDLVASLRDELERFFAATDALEPKSLRFEGWYGPSKAKKLVQKAAKAFLAEK